MTIKTDSAPMSCILFVGTYCTFGVFEYDLAGHAENPRHRYVTTYDLRLLHNFMTWSLVRMVVANMTHETCGAIFACHLGTQRSHSSENQLPDL